MSSTLPGAFIVDDVCRVIGVGAIGVDCGSGVLAATWGRPLRAFDNQSGVNGGAPAGCCGNNCDRDGGGGTIGRAEVAAGLFKLARSSARLFVGVGVGRGRGGGVGAMGCCATGNGGAG